ncbi:MAG: hypothetical protein R6V13_05870 [Anaerolineae bacterium]
MTPDELSELSYEELRERIREREDAVSELVEQLEREKERLDETWQELETLPRAVLWQPLQGRIELLEGRVKFLERDLAVARLAMLEEREAQARVAYERAAAKAARARQIEKEVRCALQALQSQREKEMVVAEGDAGEVAELDNACERARALALELEWAKRRAMDALYVARERREEGEWGLHGLPG